MLAKAVCATPVACVPRGKAFAPATAPAARPRALPLAARRQRVVAAAAATQADTKYPGWEVIYRDLTAAGIPSLTPEEAFDEVELGRAVLIDVRPPEDHEKAHPRGAVNIPVFLVINSPSSPGEFGKWLACKANGVTPTKPNPELAAAVAAAAAGGKSAILVCEAGGTTEPSINFPTGKASRSLKAAWKVLTSSGLGASQVKHLAGGVYGYANSGLPMVGEYDGSGAGRTPAVAEKPSGQYFNK
ncbi:hypothetical protein COHA_008249 [Chlorella ohadii]|uniref:Rhodanese domain-containing protein n=1 Tax=Chlorella ohadii TaxID=2649997 RepID=A0AAD5DK87_9CHLO|nr:hypothetical protein COHA_008249 [Chlorella ohadii]